MPAMDDEVYSATKESMRKNGFASNHPVMRFRDEIIDGRHRLKMVDELRSEGVQIDAIFEDWNPPAWAKTDEQIEQALWQFCLNENAHRRHIPHVQWAQILVLNRGLAEKSKVNVSAEARHAGVPRTVMSKAIKVAKENPQAAKQVAAGKLAQSKAYSEALKTSDAKKSVPKEQSAEATMPGSVKAEFERLATGLGEVTTRLSRMKVTSEALLKRAPGGEQFVRTLSAAHTDTERWNKLLTEWSSRK